MLPLVLFLATCFFTYAAGTYRWVPTVFGLQIDPTRGEYWDLPKTFQQLAANWHDGLIYMGCVMAILLAHEMGHFLMTVRYRIPASYPIFIPVPLMLTGTMGAVIGMEGFAPTGGRCSISVWPGRGQACCSPCRWFASASKSPSRLCRNTAN